MTQSAKAKGRKAEADFKKILLRDFDEEQIEQARPTLKMIGQGRFISSRNDIFSLFDFMVITPNGFMFFQVKTHDSDVSRVKKDILRFQLKYGTPTTSFSIVQKIPRKGFILLNCDDNFTVKKHINLGGKLSLL